MANFEADMPVFEQLYQGEPIAPGTKIKRKSRIDLVVGVMENRNDSTSIIHLDSSDLPIQKPDPELNF